MSPKGRGAYVGRGPRRGRRRIDNDVTVPTPEVKQHAPQEEIRKLPQEDDRLYHRHLCLGARRRAVTRDIPDAYSLTQVPEVVPRMLATNTKVPPSQPTTTFTLEVLQAFIRTSMENQQTFIRTSMEDQARTNQLLQAFFANQTE